MTERNVESVPVVERRPKDRIQPWMSTEEWFARISEGDRGSMRIVGAALCYALRSEIMRNNARLFAIGESAVPYAMRHGDSESIDLRIVLAKEISPKSAHEFYLLQEKIEGCNTTPQLRNARRLIGEMAFDSELKDGSITHSAVFAPAQGKPIRIFLPNEFSPEEERSIEDFVKAKQARFKKLKPALKEAASKGLGDDFRKEIIGDAYIVPVM